MTQLELGLRINKKGNTISSYERGDSDPNPDVITDIANVFNVSPRYLFHDDSSPEITFAIENRLEELLKKHGLTEDALLNQLKTEFGYLSNYEDILWYRSIELLMALADLFQVSLDHLVGRSSTPLLEEDSAVSSQPESIHSIRTKFANGDVLTEEGTPLPPEDLNFFVKLFDKYMPTREK